MNLQSSQARGARTAAGLAVLLAVLLQASSAQADNTWEEVKKDGGSAWSDLKKGGAEYWEAVKQAGSDAWSGTKEAGREAADEAKQTAGEIRDGVTGDEEDSRKKTGDAGDESEKQ